MRHLAVAVLLIGTAALFVDALPTAKLVDEWRHQQEQWLVERETGQHLNQPVELDTPADGRFPGQRQFHHEEPMLRHKLPHHHRLNEHRGVQDGHMDEDETPEYYQGMDSTPESATIISAGMRKDVDGNDIHAHGGGIYTENGTYYWFGTTQKILPGDLSDGINVYKSTDLQHWEFGGKVFKNTSITVPLAKGMLYRIERPKVIYNKKTQTYVMYFHLDDSKFSLKLVGLATSKTVMGEYQFVAGWKPDGQDSYDMSLFYDDHSDEAYLVRSVRNQFAGISKLTDDFMNTTGITSQGPRIEGQAIFRRNNKYYLTGSHLTVNTTGGIVSDAPRIEGTAVFRRDNKIFMIGSHLTGWSANPAVLCVADKSNTLVGAKWTVLGNPTGDAKTFNSQSTFVLSYTHPSGKVLSMFMADRWKAPDVKDADYLWLPFVEHEATLNITYLDQWKVKDY